MEHLASLDVHLARPGEFSERAFHNGKFDLTQVEAISDLISAESEAQARAAREQLQGRLAGALKKLGEPLRNLLAEIEAVLQELQAGDWLSNSRFAEIYASARADKGYGPLRIRQELRERGVDDDIISAILHDLEDLWPRKLAQVQRKRFGDILPKDMLARSKQLRFLRHRGFTLDQINELFREIES